MPDDPSERVLVVITARIPDGRAEELTDGFRALAAEPAPAGLLRSELLRARDGGWRIESLWRDITSLLAVQRTGQRPAAAELLDRIGAQHGHEVFFVALSHTF